jgi:putative ABC transport system permease protein
LKDKIVANPIHMTRNYITIALRQIFRNRFYSIINIAGLGVGLASAILILLYVSDELSYDQFHENKHRIYRVAETFRTGDGSMSTGLTPSRLAQTLKEYFPQIEKTVRIDFDLETYKIRYQKREFIETSITAVDPDFFNVFSFDVLSGDRKTFLSEPNTVVISDQMAAKYFGNIDPVGEMMTFTNAYDHSKFEVKVTGVFQSMPRNSHFHKDFLLSPQTSEKLFPGREKEWGWTSHFTYIMLTPQADITEINKRLSQFTVEKFSKDFAAQAQFFTQALADIHLKSHLKEELEANGDISYLYIFSSIALAVLVLACINYMNLSTAWAAKRAKEIGIRKVVGALRKRIITQFIGESLTVCFLALMIAYFLVELFLPFFNTLSGKQLALQYTNFELIGGSLIITLVTGIAAGAYPAFVLSAFKPVDVLRSGFVRIGNGSLMLRKGLVVMQFCISTVLIIGTIAIFQQWNFLQEKKLGVNSEHVVVVPLNSLNLRQQYSSIKHELLKNPEILNVMASNKRLTTRPGNYTYVKVIGGQEVFSMPIGIIDPDFFPMFNIPIVEGRNFSAEIQNDTVNSFIINETAQKLLGIKLPVGQKIAAYDQEEGTIVGVVKDFHFESLHSEISPYIFFVRKNRFNTMAVKIKSDDVHSALASVEQTVKKFVPESDFEFSFLDEDINNLYQSEARFFKVFMIFSGLSIFIGCLGIFGLISFTTSQRTKEIGIRKILGASVNSISVLLTKDFVKLVLLANIFSWPIAYFLVQRWLENFSYRIGIGLWIFVTATILALMIAIITISFQAINAARSNPVKSLRQE